MDDQGRLWMDGRLIGKMTFKETGIEAEKKRLEKEAQFEGLNRHERRKREADQRKLLHRHASSP